MMTHESRKPSNRVKPLQFRQTEAASITPRLGNQAAIGTLMGKPEETRPTGDAEPLSEAMQKKFERLSHISLADVRVHYNSRKPEAFGAKAYTKGNEIFLGPGSDFTLEHEIGHVVQQKQGLVEPTGRAGAELINEDSSLERDASAGKFENIPSANLSEPFPIQMYRAGKDVKREDLAKLPDQSIDDFLQNITPDTYSKYAILYHAARGIELNHDIDKKEDTSLKAISSAKTNVLMTNEEAKKIIDAYQALSATFGPILLDSIKKKGHENNDTLQSGETDSKKPILYAGLNSCIGVNLIEDDGKMHGVHLVLPGTEDQKKVYRQRMDWLLGLAKSKKIAKISFAANDEIDLRTHLAVLGMFDQAAQLKLLQLITLSENEFTEKTYPAFYNEDNIAKVSPDSTGEDFKLTREEIYGMLGDGLFEKPQEALSSLLKKEEGEEGKFATPGEAISALLGDKLYNSLKKVYDARKGHPQGAGPAPAP